MEKIHTLLEVFLSLDRKSYDKLSFASLAGVQKVKIGWEKFVALKIEWPKNLCQTVFCFTSRRIEGQKAKKRRQKDRLFL